MCWPAGWCSCQAIRGRSWSVQLNPQFDYITISIRCWPTQRYLHKCVQMCLLDQLGQHSGHWQSKSNVVTLCQQLCAINVDNTHTHTGHTTRSHWPHFHTLVRSGDSVAELKQTSSAEPLLLCSTLVRIVIGPWWRCTTGNTNLAKLSLEYIHEHVRTSPSTEGWGKSWTPRGCNHSLIIVIHPWPRDVSGNTSLHGNLYRRQC